MALSLWRTWAEVPERYGPSTTCYNRFVRWRKAGVWDRLLTAVSQGYDGELVMIDSTGVRVHQNGASGKKGKPQIVAWDVPGAASRANSTLLSMLTDGPAGLRLTGGQVHDACQAGALIEAVPAGATMLGDKGYDSNAIREAPAACSIWANIPNRSNHKQRFGFSPWLYRQRNLVERFFNWIKRFRGIAARYDKNPANYLAAVKLVCIRLCCAA